MISNDPRFPGVNKKKKKRKGRKEGDSWESEMNFTSQPFFLACPFPFLSFFLPFVSAFRRIALLLFSFASTYIDTLMDEFHTDRAKEREREKERGEEKIQP